jgi:hypothetical protein
MLSVLIISASIFLVLISVKLYRLATGKSILTINMLNLSFWILGALCIIPSLLVVLDIPVFRSYDEDFFLYGDFSNRFKAWIFQYWLLTGIPIGAIMTKFLFIGKMRKYDLTEYCKYNKSIEIGSRFSENKLYKIITFFFLLFVLIVLVSSRQSNPLFVALKGGSLIDIYLARNEFKPGTGVEIIDLFFRSDTMLIFTLITYAMALLTKKKKWWTLFLVMFFFIVFLAILSGSTGSLLFNIVVILFLRFMLVGKTIKMTHLIFLVVSLFLSFLLLKTGDDADATQVIEHIFNRAFFEQTRGLYFGLQIFPTEHQFLYFSSSAVWLNKLLDLQTSLDYGLVLMNYYTPYGVEAGFAGHFTSIFITEMWANFGWCGVLFGPIWVGMVINFIHIVFGSFRPTIIGLAFYAHISILGFGYFSDFIRFYYPVNVLSIYLGAHLLLLSGIHLSSIVKKNNKTSVLIELR